MVITLKNKDTLPWLSPIIQHKSAICIPNIWRRAAHSELNCLLCSCYGMPVVETQPKSEKHKIKARLKLWILKTLLYPIYLIFSYFVFSVSCVFDGLREDKFKTMQTHNWRYKPEISVSPERLNPPYTQGYKPVKWNISLAKSKAGNQKPTFSK